MVKRMSKNYYCIKGLRSTCLGFVTVTLNDRNEWCVATNSPRKFETSRQAAHAFRASEVKELIGQVWVEGPRGGRHRMTTDAGLWCAIVQGGMRQPWANLGLREGL